MSEITFYNTQGRAIAYLYEEEYVYLYSGKPVAYAYGESLYSYSGKHLGTFTKDGWIRDNQGKCVFFTAEATGGPVKPVKSVKPVKGVRPVKSVRSVRPARPVKSLSWSQLSSDSFLLKQLYN